jgi:preprotein translocase subunit YajC
MNIPVLIAVGILFIIMVTFLIVRNKKDRKEMEEQMKNDYHKSPDKENEMDADTDGRQ